MSKVSVLQDVKLTPLIALWRSDPERYFREKLGVDGPEPYHGMWDGERAILQSVPLALQEKKNIVVASGHSLGKDWTCGGLVHYFLECWGPCVVITTAPTDRQVKKIMWGEIETHYKNSKIKPAGELLSQQLNVDSDWYAIGFTTKETGQMVGKFQGYHANRVFVIVSEAQAVADSTFEQIEAVLTGEIGLLIQIGNPLQTTGHFARSIDDRKHNIVIEMSCMDNPNYLEKKRVLPGLCSYDWVENKRQVWGEDDPRWYSRVLGKKPTTSIDAVFGPELVRAMVNREVFETRVFRGTAVDVARFGDDESVIYGGTSGKVEAQRHYTGKSTTDTAAEAVKIHALIRKGNFIVVDADGVGSGTVDALNDMNIDGVEIVELHSAGKSLDPQYENLRAEMWFIAKQRAEEGNASIPDDEMLREELAEIRYFVNKRGKLQIEDKDDIKERLGRSPNRADAWVYLQYGFHQASEMKKKDGWSPSDNASNSGVSSRLFGGVGAMAA